MFQIARIQKRYYFVWSLALIAALHVLVLFHVENVKAQTSAGKKVITHEMMWLMKRVGAPVPSPDGRWIVFPITEPAYDEKEQVSDLWIIAAEGGTPRRLTFSKGGESGVIWSPDSRRLAFSAKREGDEVNQIYVMDVVAGGEAMRVTSLSTGARAPQWRPDGEALLFVSSVYPGAADDEANKKIATERKAQKYKARVYDGFPIRHWDKWLEDTQAHLFVQALQPEAKAKDLLAGTKFVSEPGFGGSLGNSGDEINAVWSPDGQSIVFVATTNRNVAAYASSNTLLYKISATGGEPSPVTNGASSYGQPVFSPDGKSLLFSVTEEDEDVYNLTRLATMPWPAAGPVKVLTGASDRSVGAFATTPDGKLVYFLAEDAGHEQLYSVAVNGGDVSRVFEMSQGVYTNLKIPGKANSTMLFANWESAINPNEVVRIDPKAGRHERLTSIDVERAAQFDWQPLKHFWFTTKAGNKIHSMVALPPNFDANKKYPLLVLLHGGPASMWRDQFFLRWNYHLLAQPGYVVLLTDYTGSTGYGEKFGQAIKGEPFIGPTADINEAADEAVRLYPFIDGSRMAAGGASYGGHLANWLQATNTRYKALFAHAGLINLESQWGTSDTIYHREVNNGGPVWEQGPVWKEQNPIRFAKNFHTPILLSVGENDFRVPLNQTLENWSVLQRLRVPSRLIIFPEENHWIQKGENSRFFYKELQSWLAKYLKPESRKPSAE